MHLQRLSVRYLLLAIAFYVIGLLVSTTHIVPPAYLRWCVGGAWLIAVGFNVLAVRDMYVGRTRS